ncbi:hypothetical protein [Mesobacillus zeae]|uniref:Uncharacterized protein n=1 Tax=Mesobacillus zeae TaxID=1917180 RepID=A0A398B747_9BACI|nr:hypothetical protein [Mesobacillus zeae]RID85662.1 hypothetical protein D1970_08900 [Mesobacillus zeae]
MRISKNKSSPFVIDLKDVGLPRQVLLLIKRVYNDPNTNRHTKDLIRFELQKLLGREFDIKGFLNNQD